MAESENSIQDDRFRFGENWRRFLKVIDEERIAESRKALSAMLGMDDLSGKSFLDIGCGSGLSSLAARRLGARVHAFDFDPQSVACAEELKRRYFADDGAWRIERGSVLDRDYLASLGTFDIVYSWGVLHHTGAMREALENVLVTVAPGGLLHISIYNDQGTWSVIWKKVKRLYNSLPAFLRPLYVVLVAFPRELRSCFISLMIGQPGRYIQSWTNYQSSRGMSRWHDLVDWIGGYPYEFAKPEEIFEFYRDRGFTLLRLVTHAGGAACNEFVFRKD